MGEFLISTVLPFVLVGFLGVIVVVTLLSLPQLGRSFLKIPRTYQVLLLAILALAAYLRFTLVPSEQRVLFDEDRYLSYAVTFAKFGKAVSIDVASQTEPIVGKPDQAVRSTVPVINALVLKATNYNESALYQAAKVASVFTVLLMFMLCVLVFKRYLVATIASFLMAVFPVAVYWSTSTSLDSYFMLTALLTMCGAAWYARRPEVRTIVFFAASLFLFLCVRVEAIVLLPLAFAMILAIRKSENKPLIHKTDKQMAAVVAPLILFRIFISITVIGQKWCCAEALPLEAFSPTYTIRNLLPNIIDLFSRSEIPFVFTILAAISAVAAFSKENLRTHIFTAWFLIFFALYSSYYAGRFFSYEFSGSYGRFFLMLIPPFVILASLSIETLLNKIWHAPKKKRFGLGFLVLLMALTLYPTISQYTSLIRVSPYYNIVEKGPHELRKFLLNEMLPHMPENAVVIHNLTAIPLMHGYGSVFFGSFIDDPKAVDFVAEQLKNGHPVYSAEAPQCVVFEKRCVIPAEKLVLERINRNATPSGQLEYVRVRLKTASDSGKLLYQK